MSLIRKFNLQDGVDPTLLAEVNASKQLTTFDTNVNDAVDELKAEIKSTQSVVSTLNSSTTILLSGATFTGTGEDVSLYSSISISYNSDVMAAASGLVMEFSSDGTNWDLSLIGSLEQATTQVHKLSVVAKYFRVVYTNGSTNQASFRLQVLYHQNA